MHLQQLHQPRQEIGLHGQLLLTLRQKDSIRYGLQLQTMQGIAVHPVYHNQSYINANQSAIDAIVNAFFIL